MNNVVINNTTIVNVRNINRFSNINVRNAVVGIPRDRFGRGGVDHVRIAEDQAHRLQPLRGSLGVRPVAASLVPNVGQAQRPPDRVQARRVVATRPPQDPTPRLRAAGIEQRGPMRRPEARVVTPTRAARGQAPSGAAEKGGQPPPAGLQEHGASPDRSGHLERGGRMVAPPPPGHEGTVERVAPERGRHGASGAASEGSAPNVPANRPDRGANHGSGPSSQERGSVQGDGTAPVPNGERGRHAVAPPPPTERHPAAKDDRVNERGGSSTRPEAPSRPQDAPVHERGHQVTPQEQAVQPPPPQPAHERPAKRSVPPARGPSEQVAPLPHGHSQQAVPPPGERSERTVPPAREERVMPPAHDHSRHGAPAAHENAAPAPEHAAPPAPSTSSNLPYSSASGTHRRRLQRRYSIRRHLRRRCSVRRHLRRPMRRRRGIGVRRNAPAAQ